MKSPLLDFNMRPFFVDAAQKLGFVRLEAIDWIIEQSHTPDGLARGAESIRRANPHRWREALTEVGIVAPETSFDETFWMAILNARRAERFARDMKMVAKIATGRFFPAAVLTVAAVPKGYCAASEAMDRKILSRLPDLPWRGCEHLVCRCSWRLITRVELEKLISLGEAADLRDEIFNSESPIR